ncbi:MAG: hypothetical protein R3C68_19295 [Myxococcota bacterium]
MKHLRHFIFALFCTTALGVWLSPGISRAEGRSWRIAVEPGMAHLRERNARSWSGGGGISLSVDITQLIAVNLHVEHKMSWESDADFDISAAGLGGTYRFDTLVVSPFLEGGIAYLRISQERPLNEWLPFLGIGIETPLKSWLRVGIILRYYPLLNSELLEPAYGTLNGRLSFVLGST